MEFCDENFDGKEFRNRDDLVEAVFLRCTLRNADFRGAALDRVDFTGLDLEGAQFQDASLKGAILTNVTNLSTESLGGADLTGASVPDGWEFEGLDGVAEASKYLQSLFKIILALSAFSTLTIFSTPDELLILREAAHGTTLPFISATIAPRHFGWIAPLLLLTLFVYLVTYLTDTWVQLSKLPAVFPDGSPLDRRAYPLSLNCLIRRYSANLQESPPIIYEIFIAYIFMFVVTLCTLFALWLNYLKLHSWPITGIQALCLSIAVQMTLYHRVVSIVVLGEKGWRTEDENWDGGHPARWLRKWNRAQFEIARALLNESRGTASRSKFLRALARSAWPLLACFFCLCILSHFAFQSGRRWFRVDIGHKVLSHVVATDGNPLVSGPDLERIKLQYADATGAYLRNADLKYVDFTGAILADADFTGADISGCNFSGTSITPEQLRKAKQPVQKNLPKLPDGMSSPWEEPSTVPVGQTSGTRRQPVVADVILGQFQLRLQVARIPTPGAEDGILGKNPAATTRPTSIPSMTRGAARTGPTDRAMAALGRFGRADRGRGRSPCRLDLRLPRRDGSTRP